MNWFANKRQDFIRRRIKQVGWIRRATLIREFLISPPTASADLQTFKDKNPSVMVYNFNTKRYERK